MLDNRLFFERGNGNLLVLLEENRFAEIILLADGRFQFAGEHERRLRKKTMSHAGDRFSSFGGVDKQVTRGWCNGRLSRSGCALSFGVYRESATTQRKQTASEDGNSYQEGKSGSGEVF